jgi:acetyl-CoA acetyltransferase
MARLLYLMQRDGLKRGIVTLCIGGRQNIARAGSKNIVSAAF